MGIHLLDIGDTLRLTIDSSKMNLTLIWNLDREAERGGPYDNAKHGSILLSMEAGERVCIATAYP